MGHACGCPGSAARVIERTETTENTSTTKAASELSDLKTKGKNIRQYFLLTFST